MARLQFVDCIRHIVDEKYSDALDSLKNALNKSLQSKIPPKGKDVASQLLAVVAALEHNLKKAYGEQWEKQIPKILKGLEKLSCSFCGKDQQEVRELIAGPGAYIRDECIDLCNDIVESNLKMEEELKNSRSKPKKK